MRPSLLQLVSSATLLQGEPQCLRFPAINNMHVYSLDIFGVVSLHKGISHAQSGMHVTISSPKLPFAHLCCWSPCRRRCSWARARHSSPLRNSKGNKCALSAAKYACMKCLRALNVAYRCASLFRRCCWRRAGPCRSSASTADAFASWRCCLPRLWWRRFARVSHRCLLFSE